VANNLPRFLKDDGFSGIKAFFGKPSLLYKGKIQRFCAKDA